MPDGQLVDRRLGLRAAQAARCPAEFDGALFFADYIAQLHLGDGARHALRSRSRRTSGSFRDGAAHPVDLQFGPDNDLYYADYWAGRSSGSTTPRATSRRGRR